MKLITYRVQFETQEKQPGCDNGYLTIRTFDAYNETDLQQEMRKQLGYAPPVYYIIEPKEQAIERWEGVIIEHRPAPETYGGVGVCTVLGNYAVVKEDQKKAAGNIGKVVVVSPVEDCYKTVRILGFKPPIQ